MTTLKPGDHVYVDPNFPGAAADVLGREFIVQKINPKNVKCAAVDGGRGINYPATSLVVYDGGGIPGPERVQQQPVEFFTAGEIVTLARPWKDWTTETPLVVLADKGRRVNVTPLGGAGDMYLRTPHVGLVKRDLAWLTERLVEQA